MPWPHGGLDGKIPTMGFWTWLWENWFSILQTGGIIGGLVLASASFSRDAKARRIANLITITEHHRNIWAQLFDRPELTRVVEASVDLRRKPITEAENLFVNLLIVHLSTAYRALNDGMLVRPEQLQRDIQWFFALPIPRAIWSESKILQDRRFIEFVEAANAEKRLEN